MIWLILAFATLSLFGDIEYDDDSGRGKRLLIGLGVIVVIVAALFAWAFVYQFYQGVTR